MADPLVGHRLSHGGGVAADHGRGGWLDTWMRYQNIAQYIHLIGALRSGQGRRMIGIGPTRAAPRRRPRALISIVPRRGWAGSRGHRDRQAPRTSRPRRSADWATTKKANELYADTYPIVALAGVAKMPPNYPADGEKAMIKNDVEWMSKNRDRILAEWTKRYDGKSAPKAK